MRFSGKHKQGLMSATLSHIISLDEGFETATGAAGISPPAYAEIRLTQRTDIPDAEKYYLTKGKMMLTKLTSWFKRVEFI